MDINTINPKNLISPKVCAILAAVCVLQAILSFMGQQPTGRTKSDMLAVAKSFRTVADNIAAGRDDPSKVVYSSVQDAMQATRELNQAALSSRQEMWQDWMKALAEKLSRIRFEGRFSTLDDVEREFLVVASELEREAGLGPNGE